MRTSTEQIDVSAHEPRRPAPRAPLNATERRRVVLASVVPIFAAAAILTPIAIVGGASAGDVVVASLVYGGLVGLATGFVAVDRQQARQCPRCSARNPRGGGVCAECGYDLAARPRYACAERHAIYLEPGLCDCGRRLQDLPTARGIGPEVRWILKAGAWLFAFLLLAGIILQFTAR